MMPWKPTEIKYAFINISANMYFISSNDFILVKKILYNNFIQDTP